MKEKGKRQTFGPFHGEVAAEFDSPELRAALASLPDILAQGSLVSAGRNRMVRCRIRTGDRWLDLAVKEFGPRSPLARVRGDALPSKAFRSWVAACRLWEKGKLTPAPVAWLEGRDGTPGPFFLAEFSPDRPSFRETLNLLYRKHPDCGALMDLLQAVADAVRAMHEAGLSHRDLGNQNILLRPAAPFSWIDPQFIDLNRARLRDTVSVRERARDMSRITLPSDYLRIFFQMYFGGPAPDAFLRWERLYRTRFSWHTRTRVLRHPIRERNKARGNEYPAPRDIWIWDERSGQAISAWTPRDRRHLYPHGAYLRAGAAMARSLPGMVCAYRRLLRSAFENPVCLAGRIGVAVQARPETEEREQALLHPLGTVPVRVRFYHHETEAHWRRTADAVCRLRHRGHRVTIAFVQDRKAVLDPVRWRAFILGVLAQVREAVEAVEIGHAINRVKWGIWSPAEYRKLMEPAAEAMALYPSMDWLGPAGIDAEFPRILALLHALPDGVRFSALSQHLYVDRRGAPENRQGRMTVLEKAAAARAMAIASGRCGDRLVVSEVNWPLAGTGIYSPVCSPYMYPGQTVGAPNVDEETAADYMLRYVMRVLVSGLAERVFWWRLAARGYGLADDGAGGEWRTRPAFDALAFFLHQTGKGRFLRGIASPPGTTVWLFETEGRQQVWAYAHPAPVWYCPPFRYASLSFARDRSVERDGSRVVLAGTPLLFSDVQMEA